MTRSQGLGWIQILTRSYGLRVGQEDHWRLQKGTAQPSHQCLQVEKRCGQWIRLLVGEKQKEKEGWTCCLLGTLVWNELVWTENFRLTSKHKESLICPLQLLPAEERQVGLFMLRLWLWKNSLRQTSMSTYFSSLYFTLSSVPRGLVTDTTFINIKKSNSLRTTASLLKPPTPSRFNPSNLLKIIMFWNFKHAAS